MIINRKIKIFLNLFFFVGCGGKVRESASRQSASDGNGTRQTLCFSTPFSERAVLGVTSIISLGCQERKEQCATADSPILEPHPFLLLGVCMAGKVLKSDSVIVKNVYFIGEGEKRVNKKKR
jgi:hypothetical protein